MLKTNINSWFGNFSESENRFVYKVGPKGPKKPAAGPKPPEKRSEIAEMQDEYERQRLRWEAAFKYLEIAASGNPDLEALLRNRTVRRMIRAQIELKPDKTTDYLPKAAQTLVEHYHEAFKGEGKKVEQLNYSLTMERERFIGMVAGAFDDVETAQENYKELAKTGESEILPGSKEVVPILKTKKEITRERQHLLLEVAAAVVGFGEKPNKEKPKLAEVKELVNIFWKKNTAKLDKYFTKDELSKLKKNLDDAKTEKAMLDSLSNLNAMKLSDEETAVLSKARDDADAEWKELDNDQNLYIQQLFPEREKYLKRLAGYNVELLLHEVRDPKSGTLNLESLALTLQVLSPKKSSEVHLKKLKGMKNEEEIKKYMRVDLGIKDNPAGVSMGKLYLRAQLPKEVTDAMEKHGSEIADVNIGVLFDMSKVDPAKTFDENFEMLFEAGAFTKEVSFTANKKGLKLDEKKFVDTLTFILMGTGGKAKAEEILRKLKDAGVILSNGTIKESFGKADTFLAKVKGAALGIDIGAEAKGLITIMRAEHVHEIKLTEKIKNLGAEAMKTGTAAAGIWWDWVKTLPRNLASDKELLRMVKRKGELERYRNALDDVIDASTKAAGGGGSLQASIAKLKGIRDSQVMALQPLESAAKVLDHVRQAEYLLKANAVLIDHLNSAEQWEKLDVRHQVISDWIGIHKGLDAAKAYIKNPEAYLKANPDVAKAGEAQLKKYYQLEVGEKEDILVKWEQRGINLNPRALEALAEMKLLTGRTRIENWMDDRLAAVVALSKILEDTPQKEQMLEAFRDNKDVGEFTANDARKCVLDIQRRLQDQRRQERGSAAFMERDEIHRDPIEGGLRDVLGTMKELWKGDMVNKGMVIAAAIAGIWLIRAAWKRGGWSKGILVGLPLLLIANAAYKKKTGKDMLGKALHFLPEDQRKSPIAQFLRKSAKIDKRYEQLGNPVGFKAMQQLETVGVGEMLVWRQEVRAGRTTDFERGIPESLDLKPVVDAMGDKGSNKAAAEVVLNVFEAGLIEVAALHGKDKGTIESRIKWGAEYVEASYVRMEPYGDEKSVAIQKLSGRNPSIVDILNEEALTEEMDGAIARELSPLERGSEAFDWAKKNAGLGARKTYKYLRTKQMQVGEAIPPMYESGKEWVFDTSESIYDWVRTVYPKLKAEVSEEMTATLRFLKETGKELGLQIIDKGSGILEFVVVEAIELTSRTGELMKKLHARIMAQPQLHYLLRPIEEWIMYVIGVDYMVELNDEQAIKQLGIEVHVQDSNYSTGENPIRDVTREYSISTFFPTKRANALKFATSHSSGKVEVVLGQWRDKISNALFGTNFATIKQPEMQRFVLEILEKNLAREIAKIPKIKDAEKAYQRVLDTENNKKETLGRERLDKYNDFTAAETLMKGLEKEYNLTFKTPETTLRELLNESNKKIQKLKESRAKSTAKISVYTLKRNAAVRASDWPKEKINQGLIKAEQLNVDRVNLLLPAEEEKAAKYHVSVFVAGLPSAVRADKPQLSARINNFISAEKVRVEWTDEEQTPNVDHMYMVETYTDEDSLAFARYEYAKRVTQLFDDYQQSKADFNTANTDYQEVDRKFAEAVLAYNTLQRNGVPDVELKLEDLLKVEQPGLPAVPGGAPTIEIIGAGADIDVKILKAASGVASLLTQVFVEKRKVMGIPFNWLAGDARDTAHRTLKAWKEHRLANDTLYNEYSTADVTKPGGREKLELASSYARYLEAVALGELFKRATMQSYSPAGGEIGHVLHLSVEEAGRLRHYLQEREGLITFQRYANMNEVGGLGEIYRP